MQSYKRQNINGFCNFVFKRKLQRNIHEEYKYIIQKKDIMAINIQHKLTVLTDEFK